MPSLQQVEDAMPRTGFPEPAPNNTPANIWLHVPSSYFHWLPVHQLHIDCSLYFYSWQK
jgi:hypothetical protein